MYLCLRCPEIWSERPAGSVQYYTHSSGRWSAGQNMSPLVSAAPHPRCQGNQRKHGNRVCPAESPGYVQSLCHSLKLKKINCESYFLYIRLTILLFCICKKLLKAAHHLFVCEQYFSLFPCSWTVLKDYCIQIRICPVLFLPYKDLRLIYPVLNSPTLQFS